MDSRLSGVCRGLGGGDGFGGEPGVEVGGAVADAVGGDADEGRAVFIVAPLLQAFDGDFELFGDLGLVEEDLWVHEGER